MIPSLGSTCLLSELEVDVEEVDEECSRIGGAGGCCEIIAGGGGRGGDVASTVTTLSTLPVPWLPLFVLPLLWLSDVDILEGAETMPGTLPLLTEDETTVTKSSKSAMGFTVTVMLPLEMALVNGGGGTCPPHNEGNGISGMGGGGGVSVVKGIGGMSIPSSRLTGGKGSKSTKPHIGGGGGGGDVAVSKSIAGNGGGGNGSSTLFIDISLLSSMRFALKLEFTSSGGSKEPIEGAISINAEP